VSGTINARAYRNSTLSVTVAALSVIVVPLDGDLTSATTSALGWSDTEAALSRYVERYPARRYAVTVTRVRRQTTRML
jgi:hypothetical protein